MLVCLHRCGHYRRRRHSSYSLHRIKLWGLRHELPVWGEAGLLLLLGLDRGLELRLTRMENLLGPSYWENRKRLAVGVQDRRGGGDGTDRLLGLLLLLRHREELQGQLVLENHYWRWLLNDRLLRLGMIDDKLRRLLLLSSHSGRLRRIGGKDLLVENCWLLRGDPSGSSSYLGDPGGVPHHPRLLLWRLLGDHTDRVHSLFTDFFLTFLFF